MPFSFGLHPYFKVKALEHTKIYGLESTSIDHLNNTAIPTDKLLGCFVEGVDFMNGPTKSVTLLDLLSGHRLELQQEFPLDLTVIWTDPPRSMVCVEPWTSPRESLINGERQLSLEPATNQKLRCRFLVN